VIHEPTYFDRSLSLYMYMCVLFGGLVGERVGEWMGGWVGR